MLLNKQIDIVTNLLKVKQPKEKRALVLFHLMPHTVAVLV